MDSADKQGPNSDGAAAAGEPEMRHAAPLDASPPDDWPSCDPALLSLLVCPYTKTSLGFDAARQELISRPERLAFPIRDGIPILVREEARVLDDGSGRT